MRYALAALMACTLIACESHEDFVEKVAWVKPFNLRRDLRGVLRRVKVGDASGAAAPGHQPRPVFLQAVADGGYGIHARHHNTL